MLKKSIFLLGSLLLITSSQFSMGGGVGGGNEEKPFRPITDAKFRPDSGGFDEGDFDINHGIGIFDDLDVNAKAEALVIGNDAHDPNLQLKSFASYSSDSFFILGAESDRVSAHAGFIQGYRLTNTELAFIEFTLTGTLSARGPTNAGYDFSALIRLDFDDQSGSLDSIGGSDSLRDTFSDFGGGSQFFGNESQIVNETFKLEFQASNEHVGKDLHLGAGLTVFAEPVNAESFFSEALTYSATADFFNTLEVTGISSNLEAINPSAVPLPAAFWLFASAIVGLYTRRRN